MIKKKKKKYCLLLYNNKWANYSKIIDILKRETYYFYLVLYFRNIFLLKIWKIKIQLSETLKNFSRGWKKWHFKIKVVKSFLYKRLSTICCMIFFYHVIEYIWILGSENSKNVKFLFSAFVKTNGTFVYNKF